MMLENNMQILDDVLCLSFLLITNSSSAWSPQPEHPFLILGEGSVLAPYFTASVWPLGGAITTSLCSSIMGLHGAWRGTQDAPPTTLAAVGLATVTKVLIRDLPLSLCPAVPLSSETQSMMSGRSPNLHVCGSGFSDFLSLKQKKQGRRQSPLSCGTQAPTLSLGVGLLGNNEW